MSNQFSVLNKLKLSNYGVHVAETYLVIGELRVLCNVEAFFYLLPRGRISDRPGIGLLSQTFRHDILQNKLY